MENERSQCKDFQVGRRLRSTGGHGLCSERAGGLGTESGLMAPVRPLGGHLRLLQPDEKSDTMKLVADG
jgi:hypothetical protein